MSIIQKYRSVPLIHKLLVSLVLGFAAGFLMGGNAVVFKPLGDLFLNLLMMSALPLIFFNLMSGVSSLNDPKLLGRIGGKILLFYTTTTIFAAFVGITVCLIIDPGSAIVLQGNYNAGDIGSVPSAVDTIIKMVPRNVFSALSTGNLAGAIVFSTFIGVAIIMLKNKEQQAMMMRGLQAVTATLLQLVHIIIGLTPFGVFGLIASTVGSYGTELVGFLGKFLLTCFIGVLVMMTLYCIAVAVLARRSPFWYLKSVIPSIVTIASTCSSMATLPVNIEVCKNMKIPSKIYGFTIPLGAQINKDGLTLMIAAACVAAGQAMGAPFNLSLTLQIVFLAVLLTYGSGGVPGGSIVLITLIVSQFGFPAEVAGLIAGIFAPIEMIVGTPNVCGDVAGSLIIAESERKHGIVDEEELDAPC